MKNIIFALLLISNYVFAQSQPWCQSGATWHYSAGGIGVSGYVELTRTGTVQIGNQLCDNFTASLHTTPPPMIYSYATFNTYIDNNKVYAFSNGNNSFFKLYDFGAQVGDSWYIYPDYQTNFCVEDSSLVRVDSISTLFVGNDSLKKFHVSYNNNSSQSPAWSFGYSYTEKLGGENYLFPLGWNCLFDGPGPYALRCYSDSSNWSYNSGISPFCTSLSANNDLNTDSKNQIFIFPNPTNHNFKITFSKNFDWNEINIYNVRGELVLKKIKSGNGTEISIHDNLSSGLYLINAISNSNAHLTNHFIVE